VGHLILPTYFLATEEFPGTERNAAKRLAMPNKTNKPTKYENKSLFLPKRKICWVLEKNTF
jgi:hypothetical protein